MNNKGKMGFTERIIASLAVTFLRKKLEAVMGDNWRGRFGALGVMLSGLASIALGLACMVGEVTGNPISGVPCPPEGCSLQVCIGMIILGCGVFSGGLSQYGTRRAVAKLAEQVNGGGTK